ncbi:MAG: hypothetical protein J6A47_01285 [Bacilli bacterium]|nr:hypothetical protein [Bacilli bacterium]
MGRATTVFDANHPKKRGVTYVLLFWSFALTMLLGAFFHEGIAFMSEKPFTWMNDTQFFLTLSATVMAIAGFIILARRNFRIGFHFGWAISLTLLCACNCVATFLYPAVVSGSSPFTASGDFEIAFTAMQRVRFCCSFGVSCLYFYCFYAVFPRIFHSFRRIHFVFFMVVLAALASMVYSFVAENQLYASLIDSSKPWRATSAVSFTNNPNTFALIILFGIMACVFLHCRYSRWYWIAMALVFGAFQLVLGCGSGIVASWMLIIGFMVYRFLMTVRYHPARSWAWLFIFLLGVAASLTLIFSPLLPEGAIIRRLGKNLATNTFTWASTRARIEIWRGIMGFLNDPLRMVFGCGEGQAYWILGAIDPRGAVNGIMWAHNGFFQQYMNGGFIRLGFYLFLLGRFAYVCIDGAKNHSRVSWPCLMSMAALLVRSFFESTSLLNAEGKGMVVYLMLILPAEMDRFFAKAPEVAHYEKTILHLDEGQVVVDSAAPLRYLQRSYLFITPLAAAFIGVLPFLYPLGYAAFLDGAAAIASAATLFLLAPGAYFAIGHLRRGRGLLAFGYTLMWMGLVFGAVWFKEQPVIVGAFLLGLSAISITLWIAVRRSHGKYITGLFTRGIIPNWAMLGLMVGSCQLLRLSPASDASFYNVIMLASFEACVYAAFLYSKAGFYCHPTLCLRVEVWDLHRSASGIRHERRLDLRQEKYLEGTTRAWRKRPSSYLCEERD